MSQDQSQPYDRALKSLLGDEIAEILPNLLPESEFLNEQNIEIDRTTLRADLVYNIQYRGEPHILNMELQTGSDNEMAVRMLKYHIGLYDKHRCPVISMVIYPFETSIPDSPFREKSGGEDLLTFHYRVLPLWKMDAQQFVRNRVVCMYTLLPAMKGSNAPLLLQAIEEMRRRYKESDLGHHLVRFRTILRRSGTVSTQDKQRVEDHLLQEYDSLLDQDPYIQQQKALERALGTTLGRTEGVQAFQDAIIEIVKNRFPGLVKLAQQRVVQIKRLEDLKQLVVQLSIASDPVAARRLLMSTSTA